MKPIIINPGSPLYEGIRKHLIYKGINNHEEILMLLENIGKPLYVDNQEHSGIILSNLAFELIIQRQLETGKFFELEVEVDYSSYQELKFNHGLGSFGVIRLDQFYKVCKRTDKVKKRLYLLPLRGRHYFKNVQKFVEHLGYIPSGVPELISFLHKLEKSYAERMRGIDLPPGFPDSYCYYSYSQKMTIVETRDTVGDRGTTRLVATAVALNCIKTRGIGAIGGGFENSYIICEKAKK